MRNTALLVGEDRFNRAAIDRGQPHRDDGRFIDNRQLQGAHEVAHCVPLIGLNVKENGIRLPAAAVGNQLSEQRLLHEVETHHQKCSEAERKQKQQRAVVRAMEIGQPLPPRKWEREWNGLAR
jgi:hypothetical protein